MIRLYTILLLLIFNVSVMAQSYKGVGSEIAKTDTFSVSDKYKFEEELNSIPIFENSLSGLCVFDISKGEYVVEYNSNKYFTPASNVKLFTLYSGLLNIGKYIPVAYYTENSDSLIFWSTGAPTLLYSKFTDSALYDLLSQTDKDIYFSDSNFSNNHLGLGWSWDDYNEDYSKEITPLSIYGNSITVSMYPDSTWSVTPSQFRDSITVLGFSNRLKLVRSEKENKFELWLYATRDTIYKEVPFITSTSLSLQLLSDTINKPITLINKSIEKEEVSILYGVEVDSIYKVMLHESDNYLAESVLLMTSLGLSEKENISTSSLIKTLSGSVFSNLSQRPRWVDGSGLSRYNLFTPKSIVEVLLSIKDNYMDNYGSLDKLFYLLPTGGVGTLENRFLDYPSFIYAKTGTFSNNHNISGYIKTKSGKILAFSYMNNHYVHSTTSVQNQVDVVLENIYLHY